MELKLDSITDFLSEQEWYQQLKAKWEELDPQSRLYLRIASAVTAGLLFLFLVFSSIMNVHQLRWQLGQRQALLSMIQSANSEIRGLRASGVPADLAGQGGPWDAYFETIASNAGIDKADLTVSPEKEGQSGEVAKESLFDLSLKKSTIRQAVKFAYFLENGSRPVKLRNLSINTHADPTGYIDATLAISAFTPRAEKGGR